MSSTYLLSVGDVSVYCADELALNLKFSRYSCRQEREFGKEPFPPNLLLASAQ